MKYTLITPTGKVMQFYLEDVAKMYQSFNGGIIITETIVDFIGETSEKV